MTTVMILLATSIVLSTAASVIQYRLILQRERETARIDQRLQRLADRAGH